MQYYRWRSSDEQLAGELNQRVTFLKRQPLVKSGITKEEWAPAFTCWAKVEPFTGREYWSAAAVNREAELRVTIRYRKGVDETLRLRVGEKVFDIKSVLNPKMKNVKLELLVHSVLAKEGGASGEALNKP